MSYETDTGGFFNSTAVAAIEAVHGNDPVHERAVVRAFFVARLEAALASTTRLHSDPTLAIQGRPEQFELPALNITTRDESSQPYHKEPVSTRRELELSIDIYGAETGDAEVELLLDAVALGVETIVLGDSDAWPASIESVDLRSSERNFNSDGARRFGVCHLAFTIIYSTLTQ